MQHDSFFSLIFIQSDHCFLVLPLPSSLGSFSINDGNGNDKAINKEFDWSSEEK